MKRFSLKKSTCVLLVVIFLLQLCPFAALAAAPEKTFGNDDNKFYYVTLGDSVAAGFGIEDTGEEGALDENDAVRGMLPIANDDMYVWYDNYKSSLEESYPNIVSDALYNNLKNNEFLNTKAVYSEDGTRLVTAGDFDWSNLGISSFMMEDFYNILAKKDKTWTSRLWRNTAAEYESLTRDLYLSNGIDRFIYEFQELRAADFENYFKNYYTQVKQDGTPLTEEESSNSWLYFTQTGQKWLQTFGTGTYRVNNYYGYGYTEYYSPRFYTDDYFFSVGSIVAPPWATTDHDNVVLQKAVSLAKEAAGSDAYNAVRSMSNDNYKNAYDAKLAELGKAAYEKSLNNSAKALLQAGDSDNGIDPIPSPNDDEIAAKVAEMTKEENASVYESYLASAETAKADAMKTTTWSWWGEQESNNGKAARLAAEEAVEEDAQSAKTAAINKIDAYNTPTSSDYEEARAAVDAKMAAAEEYVSNLDTTQAAYEIWLENSFETWFSSWQASVVSKMNDELFNAEIDRMSERIDAATKGYQFYDVMTEEINKADFLTIHIGANDLLEQFMFTLLDTGLGGYYKSETIADPGEDVHYSSYGDETLYYYNVDNALMVTVQRVLFNLMSGGAVADSWMSYLKTLLQYYNDKGEITLDTVIEFLKFLDSDNIEELLYQNAVTAMSYYDDTIEAIHALNPDAQLNFVGAFNPFGISVEFNGQRYTTANIISTVTGILLDEVMAMINGEEESDEPSIPDDIEIDDPVGILSDEVGEEASDDFGSAVSGLTGFDTTELETRLSELGNNVKTILLNTLNKSIDKLQYALIYNLLGKPGMKAINYLNDETESYAKSFSKKFNQEIPYVHILDKITNESNLNPHPLTKGHKEIADAIIDGIINDVTYDQNIKDAGTVSGLNKVICGFKSEIEITVNEGYKVKAVYANANIVPADTDGKYFITVNDDTYVYVKFVAIDSENNEVPTTAAGHNYTAIGDSIAMGFSALLNLTFDFTPLSCVDYCYPSVVGRELGKNTVNLGKQGCDSAELLDILTNPANKYHDTYVNYLKNSDLVTVGIGSNDLLIRTIAYMFESVGFDFTTYNTADVIEMFSAILDGDIDGLKALVAKVREVSPDSILDFEIRDMFTALGESNLRREFMNFVEQDNENMIRVAAEIDKIVSDDTNVIYVGVYNPYSSCNINLSSKILGKEFKCPFGAVATEAVNEMNKNTKAIAEGYGEKYVDISEGIETYGIVDPHPTLIGHAEIANRILGKVSGAVVKATAGVGGSITPSGTSFFSIGDNATYKFTPLAGNEIYDVKVDGKSCGKLNEWTFNALNGYHSIEVLFKAIGAEYNYYTAIGDSITAGYSLPNYNGDFSNPKDCYAALIAEEFHILNCCNMGLPAMTSKNLLDSLLNEGCEFHEDFVRNIKNSDLITLEIGSNDLNMALLKAVLTKAGCDMSNASRVALMGYVTPFLHGATLEDILANIENFMNVKISALQLLDIFATLQSAQLEAVLAQAYKEFTESWTQVIAAIRMLNPTAKLIVLGCYNANSNLNFAIGLATYNVGQVFDKYIAKVNETLSAAACCAQYNYKFVEMAGVELYSTLNKLDIDPHPTIAGHLDICTRIFNTIKGLPVIIPDIVKPLIPVISKYYTVDVTCNEGGSVNPGTSAYKNGTDAQFIFVPDKGYKVGDIKLDGVSVGAANYYVIKSIDKDHTLSVEFVKTGNFPFTDVTKGDWFYGDVEYVYDNGLMNGTADTIFSPYLNTTRGMIVTILWRLENCPEPSNINSFSDVNPAYYYAKAIAWAAENKIVTGYSDTIFAPDQCISREQMAAILYRYSNYKSYDVLTSGDLSKFTDADQVSTYAKAPLAWAVAQGLIKGITDTTLVPLGLATRAQVAAILHRFCTNVAR